MKRFCADALLVLVLVCVGSYIQHSEEPLPLFELEKHVDHFERDIAAQRVLEKKEGRYGSRGENKASRAAKGASELIADTLEGTTKMFSSVFDSLLESTEEER